MPAVTIDDVQRALQARDPLLADLVVQLASSSEPRLARRDRTLSWRDLPGRHSVRAFKGLSPDQRRQRRQADWTALTSPDAEVPLPDRFQLHTVLHALHDDGGPWARGQLLQIIARVPLRWGPWKALKALFKAAEAAGDRELFGALLARFDDAYAQNTHGEVRRPTLRYLVRRGWRSLRRLGVAMPGAYPDAASDVLRHYPPSTPFRRTWVANHIFHHELSVGGKRAYTRSQFRAVTRGGKTLPNRAFADAWRRSPRPLFTLLERAEAEVVRTFAAESLKADFRTQLREVEAPWVRRLIRVDSASIHRFVVWLLDHVPRFEPGALGDLGLHDVVLELLDSPAEEAVAWAAAYARTHARDLPLERLITLANADHKDARRLARDLLRARDPRKEVGLDAWGRLLGTPHGHKLAADALREHFGARELTLDWFTDRLLSGERRVVELAADLLTTVHGRKTPDTFYVDLLDHPRVDALAARVATEALGTRDLSAVPDDVLRRALLHPASRDAIRAWIASDKVPATRIGAPFFKSLADEAHWDADPFIASVKALDRPWAAALSYEPARRPWALSLLADHRTFGADDLGFDWLFGLVQRTDPALHAFARETLSRSFHPSHFADPEDRSEASSTEASPEDADLQQKAFLFTGKLATMTRAQAQKMLVAANGKKASAVNGNLDFLVIGDEGSPLYGGGRKGSKQVKAEKLIEGGADLKIISETAFLQMLAGESVEVDEDAALAGCERLWTLATSPGPVDAPLRSFALHYLRQHHAEIHMAETDRPLDPGAELPDAFLTFERAATLASDDRSALRELGLLWMRWMLARWAPPMSAIVALCEQPYPEVRDFVELALTADDARKHRRYRLDPAMLTPEAVYRFCESADPATRALGLKLIAANPRLAIPEELFRLTESPDRQVRAFVIRQLWTLYRDTAASRTWTPPVREGEEPRPARPEQWPAAQEDVRGFLRRTLFGIPPARLPKERVGGRRLPAWQAKRALIEVCRDLALEEPAFAERILPLFDEFVASAGRIESEACLVAVTRIRARHPHLGSAA